MNDIYRMSEWVYERDSTLPESMEKVSYSELEQAWEAIERECRARDYNILWARDKITVMRRLLLRLVVTLAVDTMIPLREEFSTEQNHRRVRARVRLEDVAVLVEKGRDYGDSWKHFGYIGAFFTIVRKWHRIKVWWERGNSEDDFYEALLEDDRPEGILDDVEDLRRYLLLVDMDREVLRCGDCHHLQREHESTGCKECDCRGVGV